MMNLMINSACSVAFFLGAVLVGCSGENPLTEESVALYSPIEITQSVVITVTLDGEPEAGMVVSQGGNTSRWETNSDGVAIVDIDPNVLGDLYVMASHPEARIKGGFISLDPPTEEVTIELTRFSAEDNEEYIFKDPGLPRQSRTIDKCGHCHVTVNEHWAESIHRYAGQNTKLYDVYLGRSESLTDAQSCEAQGGSWEELDTPGGGELQFGCVVAPGVRDFGTNGACADCHTPGIDGAMGGRDIMEATGLAYDYGVHCDVCHRVESVHPEQPAGIGGWLGMVRPAEINPLPTFGLWLPLTFGPNHDVANAQMGSVQRDLYHEANYCGGCHQLDQEVLVPDVEIDLSRWPSGRLPIHSTFKEWEAGPMNPAAPCQSCHMPPDPLVSNGADQQYFPVAATGIVGGWIRPHGLTRKHTWIGPRGPGGRMLQLAAALFVEKEVVDGTLQVSVQTKNVGPGHAIPTGEPMRSLVLTVEASCGDEILEMTGGDVIPDFGGAYQVQGSGGDWSLWPGAQPGQIIVVVAESGGFYDYNGFGPFGDGTFSAEEKGMPVQTYAGRSEILSMDGDTVELDAPLPEGAWAYRVDPFTSPEEGMSATPRAGSPGFAFARVLSGVGGTRMVPHHLAVDVHSDNRLLPQSSWTSTHQFASPCEEPIVRAVLIHRAFPFGVSQERGWELKESVMVEVVR
jgi:hypothetical protein